MPKPSKVEVLIHTPSVDTLTPHPLKATTAGYTEMLSVTAGSAGAPSQGAAVRSLTRCRQERSCPVGSVTVRLVCDEAPLPFGDPPEHHFGQEHPMTSPAGGIDPHQDTFTFGVVDCHGVEIAHDTFDNTAVGYGETTDLLDAHSVGRLGVEGSAKWGARTSRSHSQRPSSTPARSPRRVQRRSRRPGQDRR